MAPSSLWVLTCVRNCSAGQPSSGDLVQVAAGTGAVIKRFAVADPQALTISAGAIWIAHFATGTVTRVDPGNGRTTATVHLTLPGPKIDGGRLFLPSGISADDGRIYSDPAAASPGDHDTGIVTAIDPRTGTVVRQLRIGGSDDSFAYGNGALYAADFQHGLVLRISPGFTVQRLAAPPGSGSIVAATSGALWAATPTGRLLRIVSRP